MSQWGLKKLSPLGSHTVKANLPPMEQFSRGTAATLFLIHNSPLESKELCLGFLVRINPVGVSSRKMDH